MTRRLARRPWRRALAWLALLGPLFYASYGFATWWAASHAAEVPTFSFAWERHVPFWAWTIFPYWTINAFYALSLFLARDRHTLDRHAARLATATVIAVGCFLAWPLRFGFGQPEVVGAPAFLFAALRSFDQPFNQAPSLHIALAVILWDWYRRFIHARWARTVLHLWTLAICASVLTTWQHHFIDIPTGALLGLLCVWLWPLERVASVAAGWRLARDARRWKLAGLYAAAALIFLWVASKGGGPALWLAWPAASLALVSACYAGLGARGFQMDGHGRMRWAARWLFAPYRLGAVLNARAWTRRLPVAVEIAPRLWLGRVPTAGEWEAAGRPRLVGLCAELQLPPSNTARCVPMLDLAVPPARRLRRAIAAVESQRRAAACASPDAAAPDAVWICCALGFSRSAAVAVGWLRAHGPQGISDRAGDTVHAPAGSATAAEACVRRARPQIVLSEPWHCAIDEAVGLATRNAGRAAPHRAFPSLPEIQRPVP